MARTCFAVLRNFRSGGGEHRKRKGHPGKTGGLFF